MNQGAMAWVHRVGDHVRVTLPGFEEKRTSRATISFINEDDDGSIDVVYDMREWAANREEEANVPLSRVNPLLPFEVVGHEVPGDEPAGVLKEQADALFGVNDYGAAYERYALALSRLLPSVRIGTAVLVRQGDVASKKCTWRKGTVADADQGTVDVCYDDSGPKGDDAEEEDGVMLERVMAVSEREREEQARILLNQARCHLNGTAARVDEAIALAVMALTLLVGEQWEQGPAKGGVEEQKESGRALTPSAYKVCCVAYTRAQEWQRAKHAAGRLARLPGQAHEGIRLRREVEKEMERRQKENKRLAKNVSLYLDRVMRRQEAAAAARQEAARQAVAGGGVAEARGAEEATDSGEEEAASGGSSCTCA